MSHFFNLFVAFFMTILSPQSYHCGKGLSEEKRNEHSTERKKRTQRPGGHITLSYDRTGE
jgi:hypothetical protein